MKWHKYDTWRRNRYSVCGNLTEVETTSLAWCVGNMIVLFAREYENILKKCKFHPKCWNRKRTFQMLKIKYQSCFSQWVTRSLRGHSNNTWGKTTKSSEPFSSVPISIQQTIQQTRHQFTAPTILSTSIHYKYIGIIKSPSTVNIIHRQSDKI